MKFRSNVWNFNEVHTERKLSIVSRLVIYGLAIAFIAAPLAEISPDVFAYEGLDPSLKYSWNCLGPW